MTILLLIGLAPSLNGSSSGEFHDSVASGADPDLLAGEPREIRSDEWNVGAVWTIGQIEQGLPVTNSTLPGGQDAAIPQDLPRREASMAFRPHLLGYLILDLDRASAWKWWVPFGALLMSAYAFCVTILPKRPIVGVLAAIGFASSPFFHWWFQSVTHWSVTFALVTMTAVVWAVRSEGRVDRWLWAAGAGYLGVVAAMGVYMPFLVPVLLITATFTVGALAAGRRTGAGWKDLAVRLAPLAIGTTVAIAITVQWLRSKQSVVDSLLGTIYPGSRSSPTGAGGALSVARTVASSFSEALLRDHGFLGLNSSEASTFFLLGIFLVPVAIAVIVGATRTGRIVPWDLVGMVVGVLAIVAFVLVPGWDPVARLLGLDQTTDVRARIGLGTASFVMIPLLIRELADQQRSRVVRLTAWACALLFLLSQIVIAVAVVGFKGWDDLASAAPTWWVAAIAGAVAIVLVGRGFASAGISVFAAIGVMSSWSVNPLYLGLFDLRESAVSADIRTIDRSDATWVAVGGALPTALLIENGVDSFSGTQGARSERMWQQIDPAGAYRDEWNRLGTVEWPFRPGEPTVSNPAPDRILVSLDPCSRFAQGAIDLILTDRESRSPCVEPIFEAALPRSTLAVYRVVPMSEEQ